MPTPISDATSSATTDPALGFFGAPSPPPPPPTAVPTLGSAPTVSSTPTPGQGVALDSAGRLPTSAPATALIVLTADPTSAKIGQIWYRSDTSQLCIQHDAATVKRSAAFT